MGRLPICKRTFYQCSSMYSRASNSGAREVADIDRGRLDGMYGIEELVHYMASSLLQPRETGSSDREVGIGLGKWGESLNHGQAGAIQNISCITVMKANCYLCKIKQTA